MAFARYWVFLCTDSCLLSLTLKSIIQVRLRYGIVSCRTRSISGLEEDNHHLIIMFFFCVRNFIRNYDFRLVESSDLVEIERR